MKRSRLIAGVMTLMPGSEADNNKPTIQSRLGEHRIMGCVEMSQMRFISNDPSQTLYTEGVQGADLQQPPYIPFPTHLNQLMQ